MKNRHSLTNIYKGIILLLIPSIILCFFLIILAQQRIRAQAIKTSVETIEKELDRLNKSISNINNTLLNIIASNEDVQTLQYSDNVFLKNIANVNLQYYFAELSTNIMEEYSFFYYDFNTTKIIFPYNSNVQTPDTKIIKDSLTEYSKTYRSSPANNKWNLLSLNDDKYILVKIYPGANGLIGSWIDLDIILRNFNANRYSTIDRYMMLIKEDKILTDKSLYIAAMGSDDINVTTHGISQVHANYEVRRYDFDHGDFSFIFLINMMTEYERINAVILILTFLLIALFLFGTWMLIYIQKRILYPLNMFIDTLSLERINDSTKHNITNYQNSYFCELSQLDELTKKANEQIVRLKIEIYERELLQQKTELDYLHLQIKPHFYANCLNVIYSMAQSGHIKELQKFTIEVSKYLRSMFRKGDSSVPLEMELEHIQGYINIMKLRFPDEIDTCIDVPETLLLCRIPPSMIQTFVENSIKYALMSKDRILIKITVSADAANSEFIYITVEDDGPGFPQDVLLALNEEKDISTSEGKRIGLTNLIQRLHFFYHDKMQIVFTNPDTGGAKVEVRIPYSKY